MDTKDIALAAELLTAVQYHQELGRRHRAEIIAAREQLLKAAVAIGGRARFAPAGCADG